MCRYIGPLTLYNPSPIIHPNSPINITSLSITEYLGEGALPPDTPTTTPLLTANISHSHVSTPASQSCASRLSITAPLAADWNLEVFAKSAMENLATAGGRRRRFICRCLSVRKPVR